MTRLSILLLFAGLMAFGAAACDTKFGSSEPAAASGGIAIDRATIWKVCMDVVNYKTAMPIRDADPVKGVIETDWQMDMGYGMFEQTVRRRLDLKLLPVEGAAEPTFTVEVEVEKELNKHGHKQYDTKSITWKSGGRDTDMENRVLRGIQYRCDIILENRRLGLPEPDFHDFRLGE